jgi:hypothetical protein
MVINVSVTVELPPIWNAGACAPAALIVVWRAPRPVMSTSSLMLRLPTGRFTVGEAIVIVSWPGLALAASTAARSMVHVCVPDPVS